ncbi:KOW domain-containing RNA-binding protein [Alkalibacter mobilis]|uniref:KOW domain-containing RNA-binding protein n=1 Tax=Alkalibacter mobilis TaxID=2787712 RepID=UPI00189E6880|nr:KOW domain-containing RNA-binding protein [Alkalibacter mobilis]MBF7095969.1 KOW domain-containing RNA-binding protein [Alkalibacter mobilis]
MDNSDLSLGQVVRSTAGRDKGRFMVVIRNEENGLLALADGDVRRIEKSKTKKVKHVAKTNFIIEEVREKLSKGLKVNNAELRRGLDKYKKDCLIGEQEVVK